MEMVQATAYFLDLNIVLVHLDGTKQKVDSLRYSNYTIFLAFAKDHFQSLSVDKSQSLLPSSKSTSGLPQKEKTVAEVVTQNLSPVVSKGNPAPIQSSFNVKPFTKRKVSVIDTHCHLDRSYKCLKDSDVPKYPSVTPVVVDNKGIPATVPVAGPTLGAVVSTSVSHAVVDSKSVPITGVTKPKEKPTTIEFSKITSYIVEEELVKTMFAEFGEFTNFSYNRNLQTASVTYLSFQSALDALLNDYDFQSSYGVIKLCEVRLVREH